MPRTATVLPRRFCYRATLLAGVLLAALAAHTAPAQTLTMRSYTAANGLPQSSVYCLAQDNWGRLWAGTQAGVCVYNGQNFTTYGGKDGLSDSHVRAIAAAPDGPTIWLGQQYAGLSVLGADQRIRPVRVPGMRLPGRLSALWAGPGEVWVGTETQGLWRLRYQPGRPDTLAQHWSMAHDGLPTDSIESLAPGLRGRLWVATPHGLLLFDQRSGQLLPAERAALPPELRETVYGFWRVSDSVAWVGTRRGLLRVSATGPGGWQLRRFTTAQGLCANQIVRVVQDAAGRVWANTAVGICQGTRDGAGWRFRCLARPEIFDNDRARDLQVDREGNVWVAAVAGLDQYLTDERFAQFSQADGLAANAVNAIIQPQPSELWVGTQHNISILPLTATTGPRLPLHTLVVPARNEAGHEVLGLLADHRGGVWVGTFRDGARRYDRRTGRWQDFGLVPGLAGQSVASMAEDRRGRIWLTTHYKGVTVYDPATGAFRTYRMGDNGLASNDFWQIFRDHRGNLWLASDDAGLIAVDTEHDTFRRVDGLPGRLSLGSISEDARGDLWLGPVSMALLRYEPATGRLHHYGAQSGLQSINPYFVQCDSAGQVWVGTHLGVDVLNVGTGLAQSYGRAEGFGGGETDENAVLLDGQGRLWMGTVGGLMLYDPHRAPKASTAPAATLTGLQVALRDTALTDGLALPYRLNSLTFDYLGVSLARPGSVRYQYRLRGLDEGDRWVGPVAGTSATYANLPPGHYTFEVRASTGPGGWSAQPAAFSFDIGAPWWRRWWAWLLYAAALALLLYGVRRRTRGQERERAERALERQALGHLQELDRVKTEFFTNVSHELRTPLTLILGPAELLADTAPDASNRQRGGLVLGQARKLLALINQLLDLSKLDAGALRLHPTASDVAGLARHLAASFGSLAESRGIALHLDAPAGPVPLVFDAVKLDEVLTNLLANALRFTPAGGQVTLRVAELPPAVAAPAGLVELTVQDTGPGIEAEHLPHLFDRFYQAGSAGASRQGTGIGLALVRELVGLHGGSVDVSSPPGAGACFRVRLPRTLAAAGASGAGETREAAPPPALPAPARYAPAATPAIAQPLVAAPLAAAELVPVDAEAPQVLIIEDSEEVRTFIAEVLAPAGYRLLLAPDGVAGLALARAEVPDLILSDVMMPGPSGYEVCATLKADAATSHIPVVLLTARSAADDRLLGLETGAQAYLPKPFRPRELRAQVQSLLQLSQQNRARFAALPAPARRPEADDYEPGLLADAPAATLTTLLPNQLAAHQAAVAALPSLDKAFLSNFEAAVLAHLGDEAYGVDQLGQELNLSRTQLHRKLKALTGQAPGEYLRQTRLLRALALLQARVGTVAEVAYQVGYANPAHFSTAFSRQFGYPPSAVGRE